MADIITTQQASEIIGVHVRTVKRAAARYGVEPVGKVGSTDAWRRADIEHVAGVYTRKKTGRINRKFTQVADAPAVSLAKRLAARNRRRTGADGVRMRAYQAMIERHATDEISPVSACVLCKMSVRAEMRYRRQA